MWCDKIGVCFVWFWSEGMGCLWNDFGWRRYWGIDRGCELIFIWLCDIYEFINCIYVYVCFGRRIEKVEGE